MNLLFRFIFDIVIAILIIFGWWHIALILALIGLYKFANFIEFIFFGLMYDALFRMSGIEGYHAYLATIVSTAIFAIYYFAKSAIRK